MKIIGESSTFKSVYKLALNAAMFDMPVLLEGETGTGKDVFAKLIHNKSNRKTYPFIAVNCATLTSELLQAELFGYVKGAFTNAIKDFSGKFRMANQGILFLDEIGEMDISVQTKFLRVLEDKVVWPIGSEKGYEVDIKIIAATNQDLKKNIRDNRFREDLFYRLNVLNITLPPLRERCCDILPLVEYFKKCFLIKYNLPEKKFHENVINFFHTYSWPGNIRELKNIIEKSLSLPSSSNIITTQNLPQELMGLQASECFSQLNIIYKQFQKLKTLGVTAKDYENFLIKEELSKTKGVARKAAKNLEYFDISRHAVRKYLEDGQNDVIVGRNLPDGVSFAH